jgi:hypothetical protein
MTKEIDQIGRDSRIILLVNRTQHKMTKPGYTFRDQRQLARALQATLSVEASMRTVLTWRSTLVLGATWQWRLRFEEFRQDSTHCIEVPEGLYELP